MTARSTTTPPAAAEDDQPPARGERSVSRHLRVVPVLFVLLLVAVIAMAVSPGLRHQLARSFTRQDQGYLEVFFVDETAARSCPRDGDGRVRLDVGLRSHYESTRTLAWTVTVSPTRGTVQAQRGRIDVRAGRTATFVSQVPVLTTPSATGFTVSVEIARHGERLLLHC